MKISNIFITGAAALLLSTAVSFGGDKAANVSTNSADKKTAPEKTSAGVQVSLKSYFNLNGIYPDGVEISGGIDGGGWACSSNLLGSAQTWNGVKFNIDSASASNVVSCAEQTISLPSGKFSKLQMLALAVNGAQDSVDFIVNYAGASSKTFTQDISDWYSPDDNSGESKAVTMEYRNQTDGTKDEREFFVYGYSFTLNKTNAVKSLTLPDNENVKVLAVTLVP